MELAAFAKSEGASEQAVLTLWKHTGQLEERDGRKMLIALKSKALLRLDGDGQQRRVSLHDLQHDYVCALCGNRAGLHLKVLEAYGKKCPRGWVSGPKDDYFFRRLAWHLREAEKSDEVHRLLLTFDWLQAKLDATDVNALIADYDYLPNDSVLRTVQSLLRQSAHILTGNSRELPVQILGRLPENLSQDTDALRAQALGHTPLRPLKPTLLLLGASLIRTLKGHTRPVTAVELTSDGRYAVSSSDDGTLRVWDLASGQSTKTLQGHTGSIVALALTSDGRYAVSGSTDHTLRVWDLATGQSIKTLEGRTSGIHALRITPDGRYAVAGSGDGCRRRSGSALIRRREHFGLSAAGCPDSP